MPILNSNDMIIVPSYQVEIPRTRRDLYITGYYALNVRAPEGTTGDWHNPFRYKNPERPPKVSLAGEGLDWNTNPFLVDWGIYEGKNTFLRMKLHMDPDIKEVYIANHFRAILDLLYRDIKVTGRGDTLKYATSDWLDTQGQKDLLLEKATLLQNAFEGKNKQALLDWIEIERALEL